MRTNQVIFVIFAIFTGIILYSIFSKKGRRIGPQLTFGGKVVQEFGEIAKYSVPLGNQTLALYGLEKDGQKFLALEIRTATPVSVDVNWIKITDETLKIINGHVA